MDARRSFCECDVHGSARESSNLSALESSNNLIKERTINCLRVRGQRIRSSGEDVLNVKFSSAGSRLSYQQRLGGRSTTSRYARSSISLHTSSHTYLASVCRSFNWSGVSPTLNNCFFHFASTIQDLYFARPLLLDCLLTSSLVTRRQGYTIFVAIRLPYYEFQNGQFLSLRIFNAFLLIFLSSEVGCLTVSFSEI